MRGRSERAIFSNSSAIAARALGFFAAAWVIVSRACVAALAVPLSCDAARAPSGAIAAAPCGPADCQAVTRILSSGDWIFSRKAVRSAPIFVSIRRLLSQMPGRPVGLRQVAVGLFVANKMLFFGIPGELAAQQIRDVGEDRQGRHPIADLHIHHRLLA